MVVLSAAICTRAGKALISRQFVEMTRIRIEGLLAAFPKLMLTDSKQQHTYVETDSVRYVYQPVDNLYLLLITNRASNIVEDLETLRLLSKVVPSVTGVPTNLSEEKLLEKSFDLLFAFDEVITAGGYREPITLQQIKVNMDMESHEEKLHNMIKISKIESAKDQARDAARLIRDKQREQQRLGINSSSSLSGGTVTMNLENSFPTQTVNPPETFMNTASVQQNAPRGAQVLKGMSLNSTGKNKSLEDALVKEDKLAPVTMAKIPTFDTAVSAPVIQHPIMMVISEKVNAKLTRDGVAELLDIKGSLSITAVDDIAALCSVQLKLRENSMFAFNTHPKVNKSLYEKSGLLQLKDTTKGFPSGRPVGILRWTFNGTNDEMVPLKINCWPEEESRGQMNVSIEYNMDIPSIELHDVRIAIPLGTSELPSIISVDGSHHVTGTDLIWEIDMIDKSNSSGSLEFTILQRNADAFFPVSVQFFSQQLYCDLEVTSVHSVTDGAPIIYGLSKGMSSEEYIIE